MGDNTEKDTKETEVLQTESEQEALPQKWYNSMPDRSCFLFVVAGAYLAYTGGRLCYGMISGAEGSGMGFFIAGALFVVIAAGLIVLGARGIYLNDRHRKNKWEAEAKEEAAKAGYVKKDSAQARTEMLERMQESLAEEEDSEAADPEENE